MIDRLSSQTVSLTSRTTSLNENSNESKKIETVSKQQVQAQANEAKKEEEVTEVVDSMNKFLQASHTSLKFELHEKLNEYYVTLVDDVTQEVVREIPSKKLLDVYAAMTEFLGLMVDKKI
ncbi:flagellar protein FlaG [Bacillus sp. ISL-47]|uniref:flagellar protein FlaG n=1 Tax=Bacillus sp. ISL-47 TaxID=2819130 RepID=UPI001BED2BEC|nr:flagellar protein FlaG [Bacillus sp. ISL-47]MBT2687160.1 flagellar protein FlaG [Bacillus sp. ISL-47]MBT2709759.1 flagellar protein FlaG [Pseudomonas sp. ISL-84]